MTFLSFFLNNTIGGDNITFKYRYRKQILIGVISFIIIISIVSIIVFYSLKDNKKKDKEEDVILEKKNFSKKEEKEELLKVDIKGEIISPGIYELSSSSRVIDVINMAGGLTEEADTSVINLSKKISDEMVIIVYSKYQVEDFKNTKEIEKQVEEKCNKNEIFSIENNACISTSSNEINGQININTASKEELMSLQGIGEAKANDIIKYREENGKFNSIDDIKKVTGIGDNLFASIKENITT